MTHHHREQGQGVPPPGTRRRRARLAVNLTAGDRDVGQQAEALVDVR